MSESGGGPFERRRLLRALGAGAAVGIAGCLGGVGGGGTGGDSDDGTSSDGNDDADDEERHPYDTSLSHPGDSPIEFESGQNCPVCNMTPGDYPQWRSQLAHDNGEGAAFDTPGCLFAYYAVPPTDAEIVGAWTTDYRTFELIDATEAHFALVTDETAADDPMGINPRPFADREDAVTYLDEWDAESLTEDDIIGLEAVDREIAEIYRSNRMPDE